MATSPKMVDIPYAPTDASDLYPETDGKPMAVSDWHRSILTRILQVLEAHFAQTPEVYVSGDILMYYVEGDPRKVISPDALVTFGIGKKNRMTYKVWEEGKVPDFVMELSSKTTYRNDLEGKMALYASLGIQDYFLYDAEGLFLDSPLLGFTLVDGVYHAIESGVDGGVYAATLGLEFHIGNAGLEIYDPVVGEWLRSPEEVAEARAETAEARAETAEAEAARLREELARLRKGV